MNCNVSRNIFFSLRYSLEKNNENLGLWIIKKSDKGKKTKLDQFNQQLL